MVAPSEALGAINSSNWWRSVLFRTPVMAVLIILGSGARLQLEILKKKPCCNSGPPISMVVTPSYKSSSDIVELLTSISVI